MNQVASQPKGAQGCIFLSYRRSDSAGYAGRVGDRLAKEFGQRRVFRDIDRIKPGVNFVESIEGAVGSCSVLIVLIGPGWLDAADKNGNRRLDDPQDFVRLEILAALHRKIPIIPLLVGGASLPASGNAPEEFKKLFEHECHELTDKRWSYDLDQLVHHLRNTLDPRWRRKRTALAVAMVVLVLAGSIAAVRWLVPRFFPPKIAESSPPSIPRLVVVDPSDVTGDKRYSSLGVEIGDTLGAGMSVPKRLNVVPPDEVLGALQEMSVPVDACSRRVDPGPLRDILGAMYAVFGNFRKGVGSNSRDLHVQLCLKDSSGNQLEKYEGEVAAENIPGFVAKAAQRFRAAIGQPASVPDFSGIYPEDPEARRWYFEGLSELRTFNARDALSSLKKAAEREDSNALIHSAMADAWAILRHDDEAGIEASEAIDRSNQPSRSPLPIEYRDGISARSAEINKDWEHAIEHYLSLYRSFPERLDYGLKLASVQTAAARGNSALATLKELTKLAPPLGRDPRIFIEQSRAFEQLGDSKGSVDAAETAVQIANDRKWHVLSGWALLQLCWAHRELADVNSAADCEKAQKIFEVFGNEVMAAVALNDMATWLSDQKRYDEAKAIYARVMSITGKYSTSDLAGAQINSARISILQGKPEMAEPLLNDSLANSRKAADKYDEVLALVSLSAIHWDAGKIVESGQQADQARDLASAIGDRSLEAYALGALALAQMEIGDLPEALKNYQASLVIRKKLQQQYEIALTQTRLGDVLLRMAKFGEAETNYSAARRFFHRQHPSEELLTQLDLVQLDLERGHFPQATSAAESALQATKQDAESQADALSFLVRGLVGQGKVQGAGAPYQEMKKLHPSDSEVQVDVSLADGIYLTGTGSPGLAASALHEAADRAKKAGRYFGSLRLQLAEIEALDKAGDHAAARKLLQQLRSSALECSASLGLQQHCGFGLITQRARALEHALDSK